MLAISAFQKRAKRFADLTAQFSRPEKAATLGFMAHADRNDFTQRVAAECRERENDLGAGIGGEKAQRTLAKLLLGGDEPLYYSDIRVFPNPVRASSVPYNSLGAPLCAEPPWHPPMRATAACWAKGGTARASPCS
jgi:hypothetical protein